MPDFIIVLAIVILVVAIFSSADEGGPAVLLALFIPTLLGAWMYHGNANNEARQIGTFVSAEVDGVAILNIDGKLVNLNSLLNSNIEPGTKFEVSTYRNYSKGIYCTFNNEYEIKEVPTAE